MAAIQSARDYDGEDEKQPRRRRRLDIAPSGFASVLMTGRIISEKLLRRCALRVTISSSPAAPMQGRLPFRPRGRTLAA